MNHWSREHPENQQALRPSRTGVPHLCARRKGCMG
uniref:Uncharacterized protein n=1 Tax=Anguilla anguilla TaxID=7936 RepID=A0A0E9T0B6_ANGAN